jgi:hypothetical protein
MAAVSRGVLPVVLALLSGCGIQFSNLDFDAKIDRARGEAVVVLAVKPHSRVSLFEGESNGTEWTCKSLFNVANVFPDEGFIVLKLEPRTGNKNYGIGQILPDGIGGSSFVVRRGAAVPAFHAAPGRVTFVGGVQLEQSGRHIRMAPDQATTVEEAERFLKLTRPGLVGDVAADPLVFLRADGGC